MICSTVIPTYRREELLARAVTSVLEQLPDHANYEIIIVNDGGATLREAGWQDSPLVTVVNTNRCERSAARNVGAALAKAKWLHFLDDDDYVLPGAYASLADVARTGNYVWVYGNYQIVYPNGVISEIAPEVSGNIFALLVAGAGIPFAASWLRRDAFYRAGCYDPLINATEDRDLGRRIGCIGDVGYTKHLVCSCRIEHSATTTTDWSRAPEYDRIGREKALDLQDALPRTRSSAHGNARLRGRACRAYMASAAENVRKGNYLRAASRLWSCVRLGGAHFFVPTFLRGLRGLTD
jgi:glycosyltransferase involved in cell wall biosynthesis